MRSSDMERDDFWVELTAADERGPERQNTEDDEFDKTAGQARSDVSGTIYARGAAAHSPLAQNYTHGPQGGSDAANAPDGCRCAPCTCGQDGTPGPDEPAGDFDLGVYPEMAPAPQPWAIPDPPEGLPVMPPDGGLPPI